MKKLLLFVFIFFISGCSWLPFWKKAEEPKVLTEIREKGGVLKVQVSPHAPSMISKRIGVVPFTSKDETTGLYFSNAIAGNLVISGLHVIESKHLLSELIKLLENDRTFDEATNEWKEFKRFFKKEDPKIVVSNLMKLRKLDLVDYLLTGRIDVKDKWFFFKGDEVNEARLDIIDVSNGAIIYSLNYRQGEEGKNLTPHELSEKLADALVTAMK